MALDDFFAGAPIELRNRILAAANATQAEEFDWKQSCRVASTGNLTLSAEQTIDGIAVISGQRVLAKDQTAGAENGIYLCATGAWSRARDADSSENVTPQMRVPVEEGTANADTVWAVTTNGFITVGTTVLTFANVGAGLATAAPTTIAPDDTAAVGTSTAAARADHRHAITAAAVGAIAIGDSAAEGDATSFARSNHVHSVAAPAAPADVTKDTAAAGSATTVARSDHKHDISTAAPANIGTANTEGTATSLARSDHVHAHAAQTDGALHAVATASVAGFISRYDEGTFVPTVTLVGGAGNVVPEYTTNTGRYTRVGRIVFVDIYLTGDGGAEGAGTGQINIALPVAASASNPEQLFPAGRSINAATNWLLCGEISAGGTTVQVNIFDGTANSFAGLLGADQNNAARTIRLKFAYEV